jgi:hypothetical protein
VSEPPEDPTEQTRLARRLRGARQLVRAGELERAEELLSNAAREFPAHPEPRIAQAIPLMLQGRFAESRELLEGLARELGPGSASRGFVDYHLGWHELREGRFREGLARIAAGRRAVFGPGPACVSTIPPLTAERLAELGGKRIAIVGDWGAGDQLLHARFAQLLASRGAHVTWLTRAPILSLLSRTPGIDELLPLDDSRREPPGSYDLQISSQDLAAVLGLEAAELPPAPYVFADPALIERWEGRLPRSPLRVGLRWQGNPGFAFDGQRSIPLAALRPLFSVRAPALQWLSLQRDSDSGELASLPETSVIRDLGPELTSWDETAAAIAALDLVITSCTAVAHLAAALGRPTWLLCPLKPMIAWALPGDTTPWYASVRIFRQLRPGLWDEPVGELRRALEAHSPAAR